MLKILLSSLLGAALCVTWGAVSWMVLEWHGSTVRKFTDALRHGFRQHRMRRRVWPAGVVGHVALAGKPDAGQPLAGGGHDHGPHGAVVVGLDDGGCVFHVGSFGADQARITA